VVSKRKLYTKLETPTISHKKWSTEGSTNDRYIWINTKDFELHWSKDCPPPTTTATTTTNTNTNTKSKCINIKNHIKRISLNTIDGISDAHINIELVMEDISNHIFSRSIFSSNNNKDKTIKTLVIINQDAELIEGYYKFIIDNKLR